MSKGDKKKKKEHKRSRDRETEVTEDWNEEKEDRYQKKARKKSEKIAKMLGYSDEINPFGDSNLLQPFVWGKKKEKEKFEDTSHHIEDPEQARLKLIAEIEKVRQRRVDRENELSEISRLRDEEQRLREASQYGDWQRKEEDFLLEQVKQRSKIRLVAHRHKPVDIIAKNLLIMEAADAGVSLVDNSNNSTTKDLDLMCLESEMRNPAEVVQTFSAEELDELLLDVDSYIQCEEQKKGKYQVFWESVRLLTLEEKSDRLFRTSATQSASGVLRDMRELLRGKSLTELRGLQSDVDKNLSEKGRVRDPDYWEGLRRQLQRQVAVAIVTDTHVTLWQQQQQLLAGIRQQHQQRLMEERKKRSKSQPIPVVDMQEDNNNSSSSDFTEMLMDASDEVLLQQQQLEVSGLGRFVPRKPRYLNRVKTGWDWNKYNQTHYDFDNPPPKVVQGYKFTLFYPDLIDVYATPRYQIEACVEGEGNNKASKEFVVIRFSSGAPYEDVAFKIVNKEWDVDRRSGFRSVFEKGVLQLHFNFKRTFYRR